MAVEIKRKAPRAHTVLELVRKRWGHVANVVRLYRHIADACKHHPMQSEKKRPKLPQCGSW